MRTKNQKQTDIMCSVQRQSKQINEITLHLLSKIDFEEMRDVQLFACTIAPNGNMIFANYLQKELIILNGNGKLVKIIDSNTDFLDVSCISNEFVAVTKYRTVEVINTENERVDKCYHTSSRPCGLIYFDTTLTWSVQGKGIQRADLENNEITTVVEHESMPTYTYLTTDGKHIYHANNQNDTVTCYQLNGEISWEFKDESKIQRPSGITTDNDSNIYIASKRNNSIVVLSSDGKFDRKVLCFKDGIKQPRGISFDKKSSHLLVANEKNTAFLYNVS
ncbi:TRIM2_3 [Mytilus edulis]|uniref:TRIM2_3 n=1 Tax=Mytilus edulis TaxID=6550 RepID=A0A8S3UEG9_MYTED|nr:TRIM2_3 [Mytilus edulis]